LLSKLAEADEKKALEEPDRWTEVFEGCTP